MAKTETKETKKPKLVKKKYPLIKDLPFKIGDKSYKKGDSIDLTEVGLAWYKSQNYIDKWLY